MDANLVERWRELPPNLANHMMISVIALGAGVLISVPLAVFVVRRARFRYPTLAAAGVIQTIPSLALLALMVPLLDRTNGLGLGLAPFGFWPAVIALTMYSILPILRNTVTGILGVDTATVEAARGLGMTPRQVLLRVQLPLAAPVIIAGIRTATVWTVGIATLATPVGQRCLGNYIFTGLQTRNWVMVLFGVVAAASLAMLLDALIGGLQRSAEQRRRPLGLFCGAALLVVVVGGLFSPALARAIRPSAATPLSAETREADPSRLARPIRIGSKTFTEQYILSALIARTLHQAGYETERRESLGSTVIFDAVGTGEIDLYVDYSGTIWANHLKRAGAGTPKAVLEEITWWLADEHSVRCLGALGFENAYALAMRRDRAEKLGIRTIGDLAEHAAGFRLGADYEFLGRPEWTELRDGYGLHFDDAVSYDSTFMYQAVAEGEVEVISAFSSDGRIAAFDLVTLEDPKGVIPPYDAVLLIGEAAAQDRSLIAALRPLVEAISVDDMRRANLQVDRDRDAKTAEQAAAWLWERIQD